jgi:hypothetical protein
MPDAVTQTDPPPTDRPVSPFDNEIDHAITLQRLATLDRTITGDELMARLEKAVRERLAAQ